MSEHVGEKWGKKLHIYNILVQNGALFLQKRDDIRT